MQVHARGVGRVRSGLGKRMAQSALALFLLAPWVPFGGGLAVVASLGLGLLGWLVAVLHIARPGLVALDPTGLTVRSGQKVWSIPYEAVQAAWLAHTHDGHRLHLDLVQGDTVRVELASAVALDLLGAARLGAADRRLALRPVDGSFPLLGYSAFLLALLPAAAIVHGVAGALGVASSSFVRFVGTVGLALGAGILRAYRSDPPRVTVGLDGVAVGRGGRQRFVALATITRASVECTRRDAALVVACESGDVLRVSSGATMGGRGSLGCARLYGLLSHLEAVRRLQRAARPLVGIAGLDRGGRSLSAWQREVCAWAQSTAHDGAGTPTLDTMAAVVRAPNATAAQRLGAAFALVGAGSDHHRAAVERALRALASPPLCRALRALLAGTLDEAQVTEALRTP